MNSIGEAMCLLADVSNASKLKKDKLKRQIRKDARKKAWNQDYLRQCDPEWQWRICTARLALGYLDWEGWWFRNIRGLKIPFHFPHWDGQNTGKLLVFGEQGLGDEIMFTQCLPDLRPYAEKITIETDPRLVSIMRRNFPDMEWHARQNVEDGSWAEGFDAQVPIGDLPTFFRRHPDQFTKFRLIPDPERVLEMSSYRGNNGISWMGRQGRLSPADLPAGISVQYDESFPGIEEPPIDLKNDIEGMMALCSVLDRVVSVPTSIVHIAGSVGTPVDVIMPPRFSTAVDNAVQWRFLHNRPDMYWHDTITMYWSLESYAAQG